MLLKGNTTITDNPHTKILNLRLGEITLGWVDPETMEAETVKNLVDMVEVQRGQTKLSPLSWENLPWTYGLDSSPWLNPTS